jgi:hypothetical protein
MSEDKLYTREEVDAEISRAVKFVNECNARQLEEIKRLREEINRLIRGSDI